jgi:hypothetical protein
VFKNFKAEVVAPRDHCSIVGITQVDNANFVAINDVSKQRDMLVQLCTLTNFGTCSCKLFEMVQWCTLTIFGTCSCKLFGMMGIPCHHFILTLRSEKIYKLTSDICFEEIGDKMQR